jgi:transcriptional regulator with XRE-family HTH domain
MIPEQSKMARAALGWSLSELATHASLGRATVARFELGEVVATNSIDAMRGALEHGGVEFIAAGATVKDGKGPAGVGVRLRDNGSK